MLDVLHYFFEDDLVVSSAEQQETRSDARSAIYKNMYQKTYKYAIAKSGKSYNSDGSKLPDEGYFADEDIEPFDPLKAETKSFVPTSDFDPDSELPFGQTLDAPLS